MIIFFLAGAAVLEVHRALHRPAGDADVEALQKRESELKAALEVAQRELRAEKEQLKRAQGTAEELSSTVTELAAAKAGLQAERDQLADQSKLLLRRFAELEDSAASLQSSHDGLLEQVESLKAEAEAEVSRTEAQLQELRAEVAAAVKSWSDGDMAADAFLAAMADLGVEVAVAPGSLRALPAPELTPSSELQLTMDESWTSKMQLVTDSRERMSRLLTAAAARQSGLPPRPAAALAFPAVKTPPRDAGMSRRLDMTGFSVSGLTPRGSRASSQGLLDAMAASGISEAVAAAPPAQQQQQQQQPLRAIKNTTAAPAAAQQQGGGFFASKPKAEKKAANKRAAKLAAVPKLEFAAFDSDEHFGGSRTRDLMRL